ncbi:MAG: nuclease-related domain-containing protein [Candidatus Geothermarchaeales archaeon]
MPSTQRLGTKIAAEGALELGLGSELEDAIADAFRRKGWITFTRTNRCDVVAVRPDGSLAFVVEAKNWSLSRKAQIHAVRQLNRNYTKALEILVERGLRAQRIVKVLVARAFAHNSRGILQFTTEAFLTYLKG